MNFTLDVLDGLTAVVGWLLSTLGDLLLQMIEVEERLFFGVRKWLAK